jgi:hypothetical protein
MAWIAEVYSFFLGNKWWLIALVPLAVVLLAVKLSR